MRVSFIYSTLELPIEPTNYANCGDALLRARVAACNTRVNVNGERFVRRGTAGQSEGSGKFAIRVDLRLTVANDGRRREVRMGETVLLATPRTDSLECTVEHSRFIREFCCNRNIRRDACRYRERRFVL